MPEINSTANFTIEFFCDPRASPKFISRVELGVEFISGIRIVFKRFINEKKIKHFRTFQFLPMYVREREKFSDFPEKKF